MIKRDAAIHWKVSSRANI